jgi:hypothetical protein
MNESSYKTSYIINDKYTTYHYDDVNGVAFGTSAKVTWYLPILDLRDPLIETETG